MKRMAAYGLLIAAIVLGGCLSRQSETLRQPAVNKFKKVAYSGGPGDSFEDAVKISGTKDFSVGQEAEVHYISQEYGKQGKDWRIVEQTITRDESDSLRTFDMVKIEIIKTGDQKFLYFDASDFVKKVK